MSGSGDRRADLRGTGALDRLDEAVERLLGEAARLRGRLDEAEGRLREVEALLRSMTEGDTDPALLSDELVRLRAENEVLRERIGEGRAGVDRLLSRIRFLEAQR